MPKPILFFDMDNVLVNFQSGIDRLDEATKQAYEGNLDDVPGIFVLMDLCRAPSRPYTNLIKPFLQEGRLDERLLLDSLRERLF